MSHRFVFCNIMCHIFLLSTTKLLLHILNIYYYSTFQILQVIKFNFNIWIIVKWWSKTKDIISNSEKEQPTDYIFIPLLIQTRCRMNPWYIWVIRYRFFFIHPFDYKEKCYISTLAIELLREITYNMLSDMKVKQLLVCP